MLQLAMLQWRPMEVCPPISGRDETLEASATKALYCPWLPVYLCSHLKSSCFGKMTLEDLSANIQQKLGLESTTSKHRINSQQLKNIEERTNRKQGKALEDVGLESRISNRVL